MLGGYIAVNHRSDEEGGLAPGLREVISDNVAVLVEF